MTKKFEANITQRIIRSVSTLIASCRIVHHIAPITSSTCSGISYSSSSFIAGS